MAGSVEGQGGISPLPNINSYQTKTSETASPDQLKNSFNTDTSLPSSRPLSAEQLHDLPSSKGAVQASVRALAAGLPPPPPKIGELKATPKSPWAQRKMKANRFNQATPNQGMTDAERVAILKRPSTLREGILEKYNRDQDLEVGMSPGWTKTEFTLEAPPLPEEVQFDEDSRETFHNGIDGNAFTAVMNIHTGKIFISPLVPEKEHPHFGKDNRPYTDYPPEAVQNAKVAGFPAEPLRHTPLKLRQQGHPGSAAHQQLVARIGGKEEDFCGFAITKRSEGEPPYMRFTSYSLNSPKFRASSGGAVDMIEQASGGKAGKPSGVLNEEFAAAVTEAVYQQLYEMGPNDEWPGR